MQKVLVFGDDTRSFLAVVRSLGRQGIEIHAAAYDFSSPGLKSRYLKKIIRLPDFTYYPEQWLAKTQELLQQQEYQLVIPCDDRSFIPFTLHHELFSAYPIATISQQAFDTFYDKGATRKVCQHLNIPVAKGELLSAHVTASEIARNYQFPIFIKPVRSYRTSNVSQRLGVDKINAEQELQQFLDRLENRDEYLLEQGFAGTGVGVSVLANKGEIIAAFQHRRLREPVNGGGSSYRVGEAVDTKLLRYSQQLCTQTGLHGVAMFEFKGEGENWILLEVNARFWGSLSLACFTGVDFPYWLYRMLTGESVAMCQQYKIPRYARSLRSDVYYFLESLSESKKRFGTTTAIYAIVTEFMLLHRYLLLRETIDSFNWTDKKPFIEEFRQLFRELTEGLIYKQSWLGKLAKRLARYQFRKKCKTEPYRHIKVICYGNICRSPFAEKLLSSQIAKTGLPIEISSYGTYQKAGRASPPQAQQAAKQFGVDLLQHRSNWLNPNSIGKNDLLLIFDRKNRQELRKAGVVSNNIFSLAIFTDDAEMEIADPFGKGEQEFTTRYQQIKNAIESMIELIVNQPRSKI